MPILNQSDWDRVIKLNTGDGYSECGINVATEVMRLLDEPGYEIFDAQDLIIVADKNVHNGEGQLTLFLAGWVAGAVSKYHSRGTEFRESWNNHYKHYGAGKGKGFTVNPATLMLKIP